MINHEEAPEHHRLQLDSRFCYQIQGQNFRQKLMSLTDVVTYLSNNLDGTTVLLNVAPTAANEEMYVSAIRPHVPSLPLTTGRVRPNLLTFCPPPLTEPHAW